MVQGSGFCIPHKARHMRIFKTHSLIKVTEPLRRTAAQRAIPREMAASMHVPGVGYDLCILGYQVVHDSYANSLGDI